MVRCPGLPGASNHGGVPGCFSDTPSWFEARQGGHLTMRATEVSVYDFTFPVGCATFQLT